MIKGKKSLLGNLYGLKVGSKVRYVQCVNFDKSQGDLIIVYSSAQSAAEATPEVALASEIEHTVFVSLKNIAKSKLLVSVDNADIPDGFQSLPLFRAGTYSYDKKRVKTWWIWDGNTTERVGGSPKNRKNFLFELCGRLNI